MPRTIAQIEADIAAIKTNPNWATDPVAKRLYAALVEEKNLLQQPAGKYWFTMMYYVLQKNERLLKLFLYVCHFLDELSNNRKIANAVLYAFEQKEKKD